MSLHTLCLHSTHLCLSQCKQKKIVSFIQAISHIHLGKIKQNETNQKLRNLISFVDYFIFVSQENKNKVIQNCYNKPKVATFSKIISLKKSLFELVIFRNRGRCGSQDIWIFGGMAADAFLIHHPSPLRVNRPVQYQSCLTCSWSGFVWEIKY